MTIKKNILIILVFILTVLALFINKLTSPRVLSENEQLESQAEKYPLCTKCWNEWKEMKIMVINEMHLDLSLSDHRKVLRKHEKIFAGVMTPEGDYVDFTNEDNRNPEEKSA